MRLVQVSSLVGKPIAGLTADIRSRVADGSLMYEHQRDSQPIIVKMKSVEIVDRKRRDETYKSLRWTFDGYSCGYSGVALTDADKYYILIEAQEVTA